MQGAEERRLRRMSQYAARRSERLPASGGKATPPSTLFFDLLRTVSEVEPLRAMSLSNGR